LLQLDLLAKCEPSSSLGTLFLDELDLILNGNGLGWVGFYHPPLVEKI